MISSTTFGRAGSWIAGVLGRRQVAAGVAFAVASAAIVVAAVAADGTPATNVRLDDGAVWVINNEAQRVGRLVIRINELDFAIASGAGGDVLQEGRSVVYSGLDGGVARLDVATGQPSGRNEIPLTDYQIKGGVGALFDRETGNLWVGSGASIVGQEYPEEPDAVLPSGSFVVVTAASSNRVDGFGRPRGGLFVVERSGWYEVELDDRFKPVRAEDSGEETNDSDSTSTTSTTVVDAEGGKIEDPPPPPIKEPNVQPLGVDFDEVQSVSSVGDTLVLLLTDGRVTTPGGDLVVIPGDDAVLQQPGDTADTALVASSDGLFALDLNSSALEQLSSSSGSPSAPVRVGPCIFGAWSSDEPTSFKSCSGSVLRDDAPIPNAAPNVELVYRVNQRNVALNSPGDGGVWADHEGDLAYVGNWADVDRVEGQRGAE